MSLLGTLDDVQPDDPVFVLRRAISYRSSTANKHHRLSAALDEIALSHLHRDSSASESSTSMIDEKPRQLSRQEIIAAQRAATRANQKAILSTQANSHRGVDVILPGKAMLRSQRTEVDDRMRYSYVHSDGETYDVSDIFEEEFKESLEQQRGSNSPSSPGASGDLLKGAVTGSQSGVGARLIDRVLNKINGKSAQGALPASTSGGTLSSVAETARSTSPSVYSDDGVETAARVSGSRSVTPIAARRGATPIAVQASRTAEPTRSRSVTPTAGTQTSAHHQPQPSIESVLSDMSVYRSPTPITPPSAASSGQGISGKKLRIPKGEFGLTEMLAVIETRAMERIPPPPPPLDEIDQLLFGPKLDIESVHPHLRDIYAPTIKKMAELDSVSAFALPRACFID